MNVAIILPIFAWSIAAQVLNMTGVFFISGQLLPNTLSALYAQIPHVFWRTVAASIVLFPVANWMISHTYGHFPPGLVAPAVLVCAVLANIGFAMAIMGARLTPALCVAVAAMAASAAACAWLLQVK